jgi:hypothetical protein
MAGTFSTTGRNAALTGLGAAGTYISLHTADPSTTGANEISGGSPAYARVATTWGSPSAGSMAGSQVTLNVPASTTITYWGFWSAATGGNFLGGGALSASETYGSQGTYLFTATLSD